MASGVDPARVRRDYSMRCSDPDAIHTSFDACGFLRLAPPAAEAGDVAVVRTAPLQLHVVLLTDIGFLHADASLRRVVEVPGQVPWPVLSAWRCPHHGAAAAPSL